MRRQSLLLRWLRLSTSSLGCKLDEIEYTFVGPHDARTYLREVGVLWVVWVVGLFAILTTHGATLIIWSVGVVVALLFLARPLLTRTENLVPVNKREGSAAHVALRGGTTRDRVLRELAYGSRPVRAALDAAGLSRNWLVVRHFVIAATMLGLLSVLFWPNS